MVNGAWTELVASGGQYRTDATVFSPRRPAELRAVLARATRLGRRLTVVGAQRSFGEHFLPPPDSDGLSLAQLPSSVELLERDTEGGQWVRASGQLSFHDLCARVPGFIPGHPPTGDRISLAGALAACTHDAVGYFATTVRAFTILLSSGEICECRADSPGIAGQLFRLVPGSFGALGVVVSIELRLRPIQPQERAEINVLESCAVARYPALERLEEIFHSGEFSLGRGLFFYGNRRHSVLLGDRLRQLDPNDRLPPLLLTDDATARNIVAQALANRFPALAHRLQPLLLRRGRRFQADLYGFTFYQRSYDRARDFLLGEQPVPSLLRLLGVDPDLAVYHQSFAVPVAARREFLDSYFRVFDAFPELERRLEQQDMIRLPECPFPLHAAHGMPGGCYLFTASFSVRAAGPERTRCGRFLGDLAAQVFQDLGAKVLLLKQAHCNVDLLRAMHAPFVTTLTQLKAQVDPLGLWTSSLLDRLAVTPRPPGSPEVTTSQPEPRELPSSAPHLRAT